MLNQKNFKDIKSLFCFLDETGLINSPRDKFFALGIIKSSNPERIYNKIRKIRDRYNYREELKWSNLDRKIRFDVAREFFNIFLSEKAIFNCLILNKEELDFESHYNNDLYKVYRSFTVVLLKLIIGKYPKEVLILLCDDYFSPEGTDLEITIKKFVNDHYQKFVIAGVCQIDSRSSDLLQLTDLILGTILCSLKIQNNIIIKNTYKRKFLNFVYQKLKINNSFFKNELNQEISNYVFEGDKIRASIFDHRKSIIGKNNK
ncbi:MAG: DUF3800 domain-containing protein [bacterium]